LPPEQKVGGSNPLGRTTFQTILTIFALFFPSNFPSNFGYAERFRCGICATFAGPNSSLSSFSTRAFCSAGIELPDSAALRDY
jgi:hypothetical protein